MVVGVSTAAASRNRINYSWLLRLRWGSLAGQAAIILVVVGVMDIPLPLAPLFSVIAIGVASNLVAAIWLRGERRVDEWMLGLPMMIDVGLLTALLYLTGGPLNPFSFLYLVNIALAAVVLQPTWTWALVVVSLACFGGLFLDHVPLPIGHAEHDHGSGHPMSMHLQGMWVAFGVAAVFIVYFIQRVTRALAAQEAELAAAHARTERNERLASLATLAAGAAHELATPLSTIAVVAKELERQLEKGPRASEAVLDARLIRQQVERCREILVQMAADAGESAGETALPVWIEELLEAALAGLTDRSHIRIVIEEQARGGLLHIPLRAVAQALRGLLKNAQQASPRGAEVQLRVAVDDRLWVIEVRDRGVGMSPEVLARAGEPFFTTKAEAGTDRGMGLGLFLARAVLERLGGALELASTPGGGTVATLTLPVAAPATIRRIAVGGVEIGH